MRVLNQLDYENILYPTSLVKGEQPAEPYPSVAKAGCGLICACMLVSILTDKQLEPREAVRISVRAGANHFGTDMPIRDCFRMVGILNILLRRREKIYYLMSPL